MPHSTSDSRSGSEDLDDIPIDVEQIDPYEILGLVRTADQNQIKKAYRLAALKHHPDKVKAEDKEEATLQFQKIQFAYTILSDEKRKKRYDETGSTKEATELDDTDFDWKDFFDGLNKKVDSDAIKEFEKEYVNSEEERRDILKAFTESKGDMDHVYENVMLSNVLKDDERFRAIINKAIDAEEVIAYKAYVQEPLSSKRKREKKARSEANEAEAYAKELNLPAHFFGEKDSDATTNGKKGRKKQNPDDALKMIIQQRQQDRQAGFFAALEARYAQPNADKKTKKGNKREPDEPPEEMFQKNAKKMKKKTKSSK